MKIVTPASKLCEDAQDSRRICEASTSLELRPELAIPPRKWQEFSHCHFSDPLFDINLKWDLDAKARLEQLLKRNSGTPATLSFHLARDCEGIQTDRDGRYVPSGRFLPRDEMFSNISDNVEWLTNRFGSQILIENNNFYKTGAYDLVTNPEFISEAIVGSGVGFLFDFAHAAVSAHNLGMSFRQYVDALPLDRVKQIHVSSPTLGKDGMLDSHELPGLDLVNEALVLVGGKTGEAPAITVEYYKNVDILVSFLQLLSREGRVSK